MENLRPLTPEERIIHKQEVDEIVKENVYKDLHEQVTNAIEGLSDLVKTRNNAGLLHTAIFLVLARRFIYDKGLEVELESVIEAFATSYAQQTKTIETPN